MAEIRFKYRVTSGLMSGVTLTHGGCLKSLLTNCEGSSVEIRTISPSFKVLTSSKKMICLILKINYQLYFISDNRCLRLAPSCVCCGIWAAGTPEVCYDKGEGGKGWGAVWFKGRTQAARVGGHSVLLMRRAGHSPDCSRTSGRLMSDSWKGKVE